MMKKRSHHLDDYTVTYDEETQHLSAEGVAPILKRFVVDVTQIYQIKRALQNGERFSLSDERDITFEGGVFRDSERQYQEVEFTRMLQQDEAFATLCLEAFLQKRREKIEQIVAALERKELYAGGEDHRGYETVGGESQLKREGDLYYYRDASWSTASGRRETEARLSLQELKDKLLKDDGFFDFCISQLDKP